MWSRCGLLWSGCSPVAVSPWSRRGLAVPLLWFRCGLSVVSLRSLCDLTMYSLKHLCALRVQQHPAALMSPSDFAAVATLAVTTIFFICRFGIERWLDFCIESGSRLGLARMRKTEAAGGDGYAVEISDGQRRLLAATVAEWTLALIMESDGNQYLQHCNQRWYSHEVHLGCCS